MAKTTSVKKSSRDMDDRYVYQAGPGFEVRFPKESGLKGKYFGPRDHRDPKLAAAEYRDRQLENEPYPSDNWEVDPNTVELKARVIEAEDKAAVADAKLKEAAQKLKELSARFDDYERKKAIRSLEVEVVVWKTMDTIMIIHGRYLHEAFASLIDIPALRRLADGMAGSRLNDFIYISDLPDNSDGNHHFHQFLASVDGAEATVLASGSMAHDLVVIASEIVRWATRGSSRIVVLAGDTNLSYPCHLARNYTKELVVMGFRGLIAGELMNAANRVVLLDEFLPVLKKLQSTAT